MLTARMDAAAAHAKLIAPVLGLPARATELEPDSATNALKRSYYDTALIAAPGSLKAIHEMAGPDHILFGCDWPFAGLMYPLEGDPQPAIAQVYSATEQAAVNRGNAMDLLSK